MSGVYERNRKQTSVQFLATAEQLQEILTRFLGNEKRIPKKWRFLICTGMIEKVDELVDNVVAANTVFPSNEERMKKRWDYLTAALINCYQLQSKLIRLMRVVETVTPESLGEIQKSLSDETNLLKACIKSNKVISSKGSVED